ncbi:MAG TPA: DUF5706 domain-containing protein [Anaerohalosphaeraceae bacterium]|nr:DUF5706 domain-containing protein [Anaerohalosphaeraceae bacterium]
MNKNTKNKVSTDFLWKIIARYDSYYSGTNNKGALLLAFNTFILGSFIVKLDDIIKAYQISAWAKYIAAFFLIVIFFATLFSIWKVLGAINPFLCSPKWPEKYHSKLYFGHVCEYKDENDYYDSLEKMDEELIAKDISCQAYTLAKGLLTKYSKFKQAFIGNIVQIFAILGLGILRIVLVVREISI